MTHVFDRFLVHDPITIATHLVVFEIGNYGPKLIIREAMNSLANKLFKTARDIRRLTRNLSKLLNTIDQLNFVGLGLEVAECLLVFYKHNLVKIDHCSTTLSYAHFSDEF
jgi:hypothetical protein